MRTLTLNAVNKIINESNERVIAVVGAYNSRPQNQNRLAKRTGIRRTRCKDEAKVLARFNLK